MLRATHLLLREPLPQSQRGLVRRELLGFLSETGHERHDRPRLTPALRGGGGSVVLQLPALFEGSGQISAAIGPFGGDRSLAARLHVVVDRTTQPLHVFRRDVLAHVVAQRAGELTRRAVALRAHRLAHLVVVLSTGQCCTASSIDRASLRR